MHFFHIWTSKSGPNPSVFNTFDLGMCFAPQWRALFGHLNFQKWSNLGVLCTFWLGNVLRATAACTFPTSQLPKVVRTWFFSLFTPKCASRHSGMQFFIFHLARWFRTRHFSEPTFQPSRATNHWKNTVNRRLSYLFAHLPSSLLLFSSPIFSLLGFSSLTLPTSAFPAVHIVGSFTSKLPSIIPILQSNAHSRWWKQIWHRCLAAWRSHEIWDISPYRPAEKNFRVA